MPSGSPATEALFSRPYFLSIVVNRQAGGFPRQEVFRRQRSVDRLERARRIAQGEELREVARAARIGEGQRALHNPEVPLDEPDHAAEVLRRIADKPGGRVGGHHDQRHTESHLVAALWVRFDPWGFMIVPAAPIVPSDDDGRAVPIRAAIGVLAWAVFRLR